MVMLHGGFRNSGLPLSLQVALKAVADTGLQEVSTYLCLSLKRPENPSGTDFPRGIRIVNHAGLPV